VIYLDASAIVIYVLKRANVSALRGYLQDHIGARTGSSTIGFVETIRTCDQVGTFPNLMAQLLRDHAELVITSDIRNGAANLPGRLKTLDAIHIATAETLGEDLVSFVTYDRRMAMVARSRGLPVASLGT
jgi:predicted nucleic acid-binding protein